MDCSMPGWTSKRYLKHLTVSPPECSCGAGLCSYQHVPCGGWRNTEIRSVVFPLRKFIVYNWGGETDRQGTAASSARECGVAAAAVDKSCLTDCHPGNCSIPGICPSLFLEFSQIHVHWMSIWASLVVQRVKHLLALRETWVGSLGWADPLEKAMATHSSTLAWRIPWTEKPGRLQSMGSQRVGHDWATSLHFMSIESVTLSNRLFLCCHPILLLLPSVFPSIRVFSNESVLHIRWPVYWSFSFSIRPSSVVQR